MSSGKFSDLYPERRGAEESPGVLARATGAGHPRSIKTECERNCVENIKEMPMVKHMISALESSGCEFDISRNLQCDICSPGSGIEHAGGYDPAVNQVSSFLVHIIDIVINCFTLQVFVCANNANSFGYVHGALVRNLLQMFDVCVNKYDFNNAEHLACTEIRKANLANCNYMAFLQQKWASFMVKKAHADCVKNTAVDYLVKTKFVKEDVAKSAVNKVFDNCYNDLEPIGRRAFNAKDQEKAYQEKSKEYA